MTTSKAYDDLVEGFRAKISGNISSVKMSPSETAKEIADITEGVFIPEITVQQYPTDIIVEVAEKAGIPMKKRRGRPKGSKNRTKTPK